MPISWTAKKQITYFLFFVLVFAGFASLVWLKMSAPTCFDNRKNQKEQGVDCGGPCSRECLGVVKELNILWAKPIEVKKGEYDVIAMAENPNLKLSAKSVRYQIKLYDGRNILIASREGQTFVSPEPKFAVFEAKISTGNRVPARAHLEFEKNIKWELYKGGTPNLLVVKKDYSDDPRPSVSATISNRSLEEAVNVIATAIIYDGDGEAVGASATKIELINGGEEEEIFFSWPESIGGQRDSEEIILNVEYAPGV